MAVRQLRTGQGEALPRPRPCGNGEAGNADRARLTEASPCPGGGEAPAEGRAGAGRAFGARREGALAFRVASAMAEAMETGWV